MHAAVLALALLTLALGLATLPRHTSRATVWLLLPKYLATGFSPVVALLGLVAAGLGLALRSPVAVLAGAVGAALAWDYARCVAAPLRWRIWLRPSPAPRWRRDVAFATVPGTARNLLCDIWEPALGVRPSGTAIVYLHGSAWYLLDKDVLTRRFFRQLAAQGHVVMDVAYRCCPETDITGMVADARRAVAWMKQHARELAVDPGRVVVVGASAGGQVALLSAYAGHQLTPPDLRGTDTSVMAVVSYYGPTDLRAYGEHTTARLADHPEPPVAPARTEPGKLMRALERLLMGRTLTAAQSPPTPCHRRMMRDLVGGMPDEVPQRWDLASPIHHVHPGCPPTLLLSGEHDSIVPVASVRRLYRALDAAGVPAVYVEFPRTEHAFDVLPPLMSPAGRAALYELERFLTFTAGRAQQNEREGLRSWA